MKSIVHCTHMKNYLSECYLKSKTYKMSPIFAKAELGLYTFLLFIFC